MGAAPLFRPLFRPPMYELQLTQESWPDIRVGKWYYVEAKHGVTTIVCNEERLAMADPVVLAFDIETTKLPLKFPDAGHGPDHDDLVHDRRPGLSDHQPRSRVRGHLPTSSTRPGPSIGARS